MKFLSLFEFYVDFPEPVMAQDWSKAPREVGLVISPDGRIWPLRPDQAHHKIMGELMDREPGTTFARAIIMHDNTLFVDAKFSHFHPGDMEKFAVVAKQMGLKGLHDDWWHTAGRGRRDFSGLVPSQRT